MTRLQSLRHWNRLRKRAAYAPKGKKRVREEMVRRFAHELLKQEIKSAA
jgi:hypothetical protein